MRAGFALRDITLPPPRPLAGYAVAGRVMEGVHDPLYLRVLCLQGDAAVPVVLVQLDLLSLDGLYMQALWERLAPLGIDKEQVVVLPIHTHSGYGGVADTRSGLNALMKDLLGETDAVLIDWLAEQTAATVKKALENLLPVRIQVARGEMQGLLATNRHSPRLPSDQSLLVLEVALGDGRRVLLYNLCAHPTILNAENRMLSADFAGTAREALTTEYDAVMFVNGSAGDMSTRFTRRESSFAECRRLGGMVAKQVRQALKEAKPLKGETAALCYRTFYLEPAPVEDEAAAQQKLTEAERNLKTAVAATQDAAEIRLAQAAVEGATINMARARALKGQPGTPVPVRAGLLQVGDVCAVCSPFELYSSLALGLKSRWQVELFGYANAMQGYLADAAAYENGDYEALSSAFAKGQGEAYIEGIERWLEELKEKE